MDRVDMYEKSQSANSGSNRVEIRNLTKNYGDLCAVNQMNLSVGNEIFGVLGPNGSGKTTTVLMLTTLLAPSSGSAEICGYDIQRDPRAVRESLSYVPQDMAVDVRLTGRENVMMFAELYGVKNPAEKTDKVLKILELSDRADEFAKVYSGGMRRRLELAQALVHDPQVLFLDEPTVGLDVSARKKIWEHIRSLRSNGMSIFVTTHYMDEADRYCDRVAIMDKGVIRAIDTPASLKAMISQDVVTITISGHFAPIDVPGVRFAKAEADELIFYADHGDSALPLIKDALTEQGVRVLAMSVRRPSLDDVFLHLVGSSEDTSPFNLSRFRNVTGRRG
ncbi:ATP-binding cassette domain-containing protein [uncultured Methanospirillum sp.]|uniref:ATP-binding cassette domain-containing protein n=1 Tax=uncultured Methanospirillum sp. TaxID=262503 RepID=UPI0029C7FEB0|nr:ATP-binding cassette domain-containing protein [uncultured Methanospirillum sp.]